MVINIPENATNGQALCMLFPNIRYKIDDLESYCKERVVTTIGVAASFDIDWWNSPYKAESDNRIYADSGNLPPCRVRDDIPDFYRK